MSRSSNDDVAEIDADAEFDAALLGDTFVAHCHLALQFDRAAHRIDDAGEFDQEPVAGGLDDAAAMLSDLGLRHFAAQRRQCRVRALLVLAHQPRIASNIGRQHRRQPALDTLSPGAHYGDGTAVSPFTLVLGRAATHRTSRATSGLSVGGSRRPDPLLYQ